MYCWATQVVLDSLHGSLAECSTNPRCVGILLLVEVGNIFLPWEVAASS